MPRDASAQGIGRRLWPLGGGVCRAVSTQTPSRGGHGRAAPAAGHLPLAAPSSPGSQVPRIPDIGEGLRSARTLLAQRVVEACEVIGTVRAGLPMEAAGLFAGLPPLAPSEGVPPDDAHALLRAYLDRCLSVVFKGERSIRLAVSGKRLKRVSGRLHAAAEEFAARVKPVGELAGKLALEHPGHRAASYERAAAALLVLAAWDASHRAPPAERTSSLLRSVARDTGSASPSSCARPSTSLGCGANSRSAICATTCTGVC